MPRHTTPCTLGTQTNLSPGTTDSSFSIGSIVDPLKNNYKMDWFHKTDSQNPISKDRLFCGAVNLLSAPDGMQSEGGQTPYMDQAIRTAISKLQEDGRGKRLSEEGENGITVVKKAMMGVARQIEERYSEGWRSLDLGEVDRMLSLEIEAPRFNSQFEDLSIQVAPTDLESLYVSEPGETSLAKLYMDAAEQLANGVLVPFDLEQLVSRGCDKNAQEQYIVRPDFRWTSKGNTAHSVFLSTLQSDSLTFSRSKKAMTEQLTTWNTSSKSEADRVYLLDKAEGEGQTAWNCLNWIVCSIKDPQGLNSYGPAYTVDEIETHLRQSEKALKDAKKAPTDYKRWEELSTAYQNLELASDEMDGLERKPASSTVTPSSKRGSLQFSETR